MRGTDSMSPTDYKQAGITPACAGNRFFIDFTADFNRDHPRVCGEQDKVNRTLIDELGSPPRVRGTVRYFNQSGHKLRITPACAGNSDFWIARLCVI